MSSKACLSFFLISLSLGACSKSGQDMEQGEGFSFFKNPESRLACLSTNLSQWQFSGAFVHQLLSCASSRSSDGAETLPAIQNLLNALQADQLQTLIDFSLIHDPDSKNSAYPYLTALSQSLDRGITGARKIGLELSSERFDELQSLLLQIDMQRPLRLLGLWSQSEYLNELLQRCGMLLSSIHDGSLSALTHEILTGSEFGQKFLSVSQEILSQTRFMGSIEEALSSRIWMIPNAKQRIERLENWRQPRDPAQKIDSSLKAGADTETEHSTFAQHFRAFNAQLSEQELQNLSKFFLSLWDSYRTQAESERRLLSKRMSAALSEILDRQTNLSQWLLAIAHDLSSLKAADFDSIMQTFAKLLEVSNDPTLDTLRAKLWSSRQIEYMIELITQGGPVPGCEGLHINGLKDMSGADFKAIYALLASLQQPHPACDQKAPLAAAIESWSKVSVGKSCKKQACLNLTEHKQNPELSSSLWTETSQTASPELIEKLLRSILKETADELQRDPYYLKNLGFAHSAVYPADWQAITDIWNEAPTRTLSELADFEQKILSLDKERHQFIPDPIEKILAYKIERLLTQSQEFHGLVPSRGAEPNQAINQRAARVFAGAYSGGPFEQALREKLATSGNILNDPGLPWPHELKQSFADASSLSHFLFRFKHAGSTFRSPELPVRGESSVIGVTSLGSTNRYIAFDQNARLFEEIKDDGKLISPLQTIRDTSDAGDSAWALWSQQLLSSPLVSKDLPPEQGQVFQNFSEQFRNALGQAERWTELSQTTKPVWLQKASNLEAEFFEIEDYSIQENRILALYYLRHYYKQMPIMPSPEQISEPTLGTLRGFFSAASMIGTMDADYNLFVRLFPEFLLQGPTELENLAYKALDLSDEQGLLFPASKINLVSGATQLINKYPKLVQNANFQTLSTFNLLGINTIKPGQASTKPGTPLYIQPLLGLGDQSCFLADGSRGPCALQLAGDLKERRTAYQNYIQAVLTSTFCPLLASDAFGSHELWQQRLGISMTNPRSCQNTENANPDLITTGRFPAWLAKHILSDIVSMGRKAQVKEGLAQLPAALRWHKISQRSMSGEAKARNFLRTALGHWTPWNAASQNRRQFYAIQFWAGQPNLLNAYLDHWESQIEPTSWADFLAQLAQRDENGASRDAVHELLTMALDIQHKQSQAGASALSMGLAMLDAVISKPQLLDAAGHLLGNYTSSENYDFTGVDLPIATTLLENFDWQNKGLRFGKFMLQEQTIRHWAQLSQDFSPDEFSQLLSIVQKSSQAIGDSEQKSQILARFLDEAVALGTLQSQDSSETLSQSWNQLLRAWRTTEFSLAFQDHWQELLNLFDRRLSSLLGQQTLSAAEISHNWLPVFMRHGIELLVLQEKIGADTEPGFWRKLLLQLSQSIQAKPRGAQALARFLAEPELGLGENKIWQSALNDAARRQRLELGMRSFGAIDKELWRASLVEASQLVGRSSKALAYMDKRLVWQGNQEQNTYRQALEQLLTLSREEELVQDQITLLDNWLRTPQ